MRALLLLGVLVVLPACRCSPAAEVVPPSLKVSPALVDFGAVKVGETSAPETVTLESLSRAAVVVSAVRVEPAGVFAIVGAPTGVDALGKTTFTVTFSPDAVAKHDATLVVASDDPKNPELKVPLTGEGAEPSIVVTPECSATRRCVGSAVVTPPSLDFGEEAFARLLPIDASRLPNVNIVNEGEVALVLTKVSIEGADAAAFTFEGNAQVPQGGTTLDPQQGVNLAIRFKPTSEAKIDYQATMAIESDDPARPRITVALTGKLRPNLAPVVCANLVRVEPELDAPRDYAAKMFWDPLLTPPPGGYDFTQSRDVDPRANVVFSAVSDAADPTKCTADPEDGRSGLTYLWRLVSGPQGIGSLPVASATSATASFRPVVTGEYVLELSVKDVQGHETVVRLKVAVSVKNDLVAQLQWTGFADVDLDLHLVRPSAVTSGVDPFSGAFDQFKNGVALKTSGDINGYAKSIQQKFPGGGYDFNWGVAGTPDDPRLNIDDEGNKGQIENVSLNKPENDARCATASCTYKLFVHYFKDTRLPMSPPACTVDGGVDLTDAGQSCFDGRRCDCPAPQQRCVADSAPTDDAGVGTGKCYAAPTPVVRIFLKGSATPAQVIPLDTLMPADEVAIGAPCQLLYVADVEWPSKPSIGSLPDGGSPPVVIRPKGVDGTGRLVAPMIARYGYRQAGGSLQCAPDLSLGGFGWYSRVE